MRQDENQSTQTTDNNARQRKILDCLVLIDFFKFSPSWKRYSGKKRKRCEEDIEFSKHRK